MLFAAFLGVFPSLLAMLVLMVLDFVHIMSHILVPNILLKA